VKRARARRDHERSTDPARPPANLYPRGPRIGAVDPDPRGAFYVVRPCATSAGYEARPRRPLGLTTGQAAERLRAAGVEVVRDAGVVLLARAGCDVTVFPTGKLLLKTTHQAEAEVATARIAAALGLAAGDATASAPR